MEMFLHARNLVTLPYSPIWWSTLVLPRVNQIKVYQDRERRIPNPNDGDRSVVKDSYF